MVGGEFNRYLRFIICSRANTDIKIHCQGIHFDVVYLYCILCVDIASLHKVIAAWYWLESAPAVKTAFELTNIWFIFGKEVNSLFIYAICTISVLSLVLV